MALALLTACGGGGGVNPSASGNGGSNVVAPVNQLSSGYPLEAVSCGATGQRAWIRDYMNDQYYWYDKQGPGNEAAGSPAEFLDSLLYKPTDRYSFTQSTAQATQFFVDGRRTGYGYSLAFADAARTILKVRTVEPQSPVAAAGLLRGDTVVSIDGFTPADIVNGSLTSVSTAGVARNFVLQNAVGVQRSLTASSADYALTPVLANKILTAPNNAKVGYLAYQEFISSSNADLGAAVNNFRAAGVTEVVLDLRYNGGGSTSVARNLASMLGGSALDGKLFAEYRYSAKNAGNNFSQGFTSSTATLPAAPLENLSRIFVITAGGTASASELVFNSLKPFKGVVTIGSTSFGKPYAFQPRDSCGTTYFAVNIEIVNANGLAVPTTGVPATCAMSDDLTRQLGDPAELRTAAALSYISTGACPPVAAILESKAANVYTDIAQAATKNIAIDMPMGEDGRALPAPRGLRVD